MMSGLLLREKISWTGVVILVFAVVYACSLAFVYVEGDDASSIAYHALGRKPEIQPPYSSYQSGADLLLRALPANEPLLRVASVLLTSMTMVGCVVLMLALAFDFVGEQVREVEIPAALAVLFAIPELFFLGVVYHPSVVGMCLILGAHALLRRALRDGVSGNRALFWGKTLVAAGLLAAGCACRWSLIFYGWIIVCDWILGAGRKSATGWREYFRRLGSASLWTGVAAAGWLGFVSVSGYGLKDFYEFYRFAGKVGASVGDFSWQVVLASDLSVFTPGCLLIGFLGVVFLARSQPMVLVFASLSALPVLPFILTWGPKQYLWFFPILVLFVAAGAFSCLRGKPSSFWSRVLRDSALVLLVLPWVIGVRATHGDTAWGPGFEMRAYDRANPVGSTFSPTLGAGAAVSTPEGPRSLWGYGAVLLGGQWRRFCVEAAAEHARVVEMAAREGLPILVLQGGTSYIVCELAKLGFVTVDQYKSGRTGPLASARIFTNDRGKSVALLKLSPQLKEFLADPRSIQAVIDAGRSDKILVTGYPGNLRLLHSVAPAALRKVGPSSAILAPRHLPAMAVPAWAQRETEGEGILKNPPPL